MNDELPGSSAATPPLRTACATDEVGAGKRPAICQDMTVTVTMLACGPGVLYYGADSRSSIAFRAAKRLAGDAGLA
jgi:hypothetical protein